MALSSKQSGVLATASDHRVFFWARLKLTGVYVGILAVVLLGFSLILYQNVAQNLNDAANDEDFAGPESHHHFAQNALGDVQNEILLVDLTILIVAAGVSYVLAGYTLRPIQKSLEAQKKFSENASHELRTPLAVMKSEVEVLLRNPAPSKEAVQSTLKSSLEEIDRLSTMSRDLLVLARVGTSITPLVKSLDIGAVLTKTAEKMRSAAQEKAVKLTLRLDPSLCIEGNGADLERIVMNLLQNAIDHTPQSGSISIVSKKEGNRAIIAISDTGVGIDAKDMPQVFERFYKGEASAGTGLGLSIVKELVEQQQGSVSIHSARGEGTTVWLRFPLA